jgi:hypothetical protein
VQVPKTVENGLIPVLGIGGGFEARIRSEGAVGHKVHAFCIVE